MSIAEAQDPLWVSMEGLVWQHSRATFTVDHCWSNVWTRYRWSRSSVSGQWLWVKIEDSWTPQNGWASWNILSPIPGQTILTQSHGKDVHVYRMFRCKLMWHLAPASSILAKAVEIIEVLYKYLNIRMDPFPGSIELYYLFITFHSDLLLWFITVPGMVQLIGYGRSMSVQLTAITTSQSEIPKTSRTCFGARR